MWQLLPVYILYDAGIIMFCSLGLDYKKLTDEDSDPLKALEPILNSQNVLSISKLAPRIPQKGGEPLTSSAVHATWLHKLFWKGDQHVLKKAPQSDHDFLHAYDTCAKYFDRLLPVDCVSFLDAVTFSPDKANKVSLMQKRGGSWGFSFRSLLSSTFKILSNCNKTMEFNEK